MKPVAPYRKIRYSGYRHKGHKSIKRLDTASNDPFEYLPFMRGKFPALFKEESRKSDSN